MSEVMTQNVEKKTLFLFTAEFPFGKSETFLETEIHYLADAFHQVTLVPTEYVGGESRKLPENVSIENPDFKSLKLRKSDSLKGLFHSYFLKEMVRMIIIYRLFPSPKRVKTALVSLLRGKQMAQWIEKFATDSSEIVLYSYWCNDAAIGISLYKKTHPAIKTVTRTHGWDLYFEASQIRYLPYRKLITDQLDMVCPVSDVGVKYISAKWKCKNKSNIQLARLGVEEQIPLSAMPEVFTIVSCSNLIALKRVQLIIEALSMIYDVPIRWVHFGDGPLWKELNNLAERILPPNISWKFMGRIPNEALLQWYRENSVSVFVNVSETEGVPVSIMEAMSFGIPVIATDVGGTKELVNNGNGFLISSMPYQNEINETIRLTFKSPLKRKDALETWKNKCNAEHNYSRFIEEILNL
jgi:glycosyltransferase involved in cell wall biosynthesis